MQQCEYTAEPTGDLTLLFSFTIAQWKIPSHGQWPPKKERVRGEEKQLGERKNKTEVKQADPSLT